MYGYFLVHLNVILIYYLSITLEYLACNMQKYPNTLIVFKGILRADMILKCYIETMPKLVLKISNMLKILVTCAKTLQKQQNKIVLKREPFSAIKCMMTTSVKLHLSKQYLLLCYSSIAC